WPGRDIDEYMDALWEQDFGEWEGKPYADLPDLGDMPTRSLANHRPAGGESFTDLFHRAGPVLRDLGQRSGRIAVVAHAGVVRAALALALGDVASGLRFEVAPLSVTTLRALPKASWSVVSVNRTFP
ncbi:MAG: histidine phosphatase family protein, partial [Rhodobacteraceae bacterium]|nr:histidine phosphatase family protein [Paracoccaceae bacterium]